MTKNRKEKVAKLMDQVRLAAEEALGLLEDGGSSPYGDLEFDLHQVMDYGHDIAGKLRGTIKEKSFENRLRSSSSGTMD